MDDLLRRVFGSGASRRHPLEDDDSGLPTTQNIPPAQKPTPVESKVLAIIHNPIVTRDGRKIKDVYGWNDPDQLAADYARDIEVISHGYAHYRIVERIEVDAFPVKVDGFRYNAQSFAMAWRTRQFHKPDDVDYLALVREFKLIEKIDAGIIDEVWLLGFPACGYYESIMAGPEAFWCNAPPLKGTQHAARRFVIMGFNYERGVGEMLEDLGHRAESIMKQVFADQRGEANLWERFCRYDKTDRGRAEVGNVHFAPNSVKDYDWGNQSRVLSRCDTWRRFPDLSGEPRLVNCADWGNGDIRKHHHWWFSLFPHIIGESNRLSWNWWEYVIDPNRVR
mgnify:CR=1 FL=1